MQNTIVSLPHMGQYSAFLAQELRKEFGWDVFMPPPPGQRTIERGVKYMQELMCFPAKVTLGSFIEACEQGVQKLLQFDSCGSCRLKTYWLLQERALRKLGFNATVYPVRLGRFTPHDIISIDPRISYPKACLAFLRILSRVRTLDSKLWGDTPKNGQVKIGLVGEIFTMLDPAVNHNLIRKVHSMGAYLHNSLPLSFYVFKGLYDKGWMKRPSMNMGILKQAHRLAHDYFPLADFAGHGRESIIHSIYYGLAEFDGVIHVLPFPCAPEAAVASIVDDVSRQYQMPLMRLIFDAHAGEAGLITRLEAFVDILKMKKARGIQRKA